MKPTVTPGSLYKIYMLVFMITENKDDKIEELIELMPELTEEEGFLTSTAICMSICDKNSNRFDTQGSFIDRMELYLSDSEFAESNPAD